MFTLGGGGGCTDLYFGMDAHARGKLGANNLERGQNPTKKWGQN